MLLFYFNTRVTIFTLICILLLIFSCLFSSNVIADECLKLKFEHRPSEYYGPGEYFATCPEGEIIRCYHYHRHWVCEKDDILYWDRNMESAARISCNCKLPPDTAPASPAISGKSKDIAISTEN
jgi:hypothetical protein